MRLSKRISLGTQIVNVVACYAIFTSIGWRGIPGYLVGVIVGTACGIAAATSVAEKRGYIAVSRKVTGT